MFEISRCLVSSVRHATHDERHRTRLVGLHHTRCRHPGRRGTAEAERLASTVAPGFRVVIYDTLEEFYLAEALEYVIAWQQATADNPVGICGPIGPTEQLPLVARMVNELGLSLRTRISGAWTNGS